MIWEKDISLECFLKVCEKWYNDENHFLGDPPIPSQYALDLLFKTLIDDKKHYPYLTTMPENNEQTNALMLDLLLTKYSRKYRKLKRKRKKEYAKMRKMYN